MLRKLSTLQIALIVSVAVHAALLTVRIVDPEGFNRIFQDTPLEVILVNSRSGEPPEKAQAIAQAALAGGGEAAEGRATSPLPPSALVEVGESNDEAHKRIEQLQETPQQLLAQLRRELALLPAPDPQRDQGNPEEQAQEDVEQGKHDATPAAVCELLTLCCSVFEVLPRSSPLYKRGEAILVAMFKLN